MVEQVLFVFPVWVLFGLICCLVCFCCLFSGLGLIGSCFLGCWLMVLWTLFVVGLFAFGDFGNDCVRMGRCLVVSC